MTGDDFVINVGKSSVSEVDGSTVLVTSPEELSEAQIKEIVSEYFATKKDQQYSVTTSETSSNTEITLNKIDTLVTGIHSNKDNVASINSIIMQTIDKDGLMGYAYSCIVSNTPTTYQIIYDNNESEEIRDDVKSLIDKFNKDINIERFIRDCVASTYAEGNFPVTLRYNGERSIIDYYPLSICYPSDYKINGDRQLEFDISGLSKSLSKVYRKTRKNKALYFENIKKEIKANYPQEIYKAYNDRENYVKLDTRYSDCIQINTFNRKFGLSPFVRALKPLVVLNNIEVADVASSKARSKNIIYQKIRKEVYEKNKTLAIAEQATAHSALMSALQTNLCAYTSSGAVESLEFVTSKASNTDASKQLEQYMSKYLQSLGISFIDPEVGNTMSAKISITQIIRTINTILSEIERVVNKFYRTICEDNDIELEFYPEIKIDTAETMDMAMRIELSKYVYGTLSASRKTAFSLVGLSEENEKELRIREDKLGYNETFKPYQTSYTFSGEDDDKSGRPQSNEDEGEQLEDKMRNE